MSSDYQAGCRWLFISHLCPSQAMKSIQNNELKHQVLWLADKQWAPLDWCRFLSSGMQEIWREVKYFNITFRLTKPMGFAGLSYRLSSWRSFLLLSFLLPFSIPLPAQEQLWIFPGKQLLEVPAKPLRHSFRKGAFGLHQSRSLCKQSDTLTPRRIRNSGPLLPCATPAVHWASQALMHGVTTGTAQPVLLCQTSCLEKLLASLHSEMAEWWFLIHFPAIIINNFLLWSCLVTAAIAVQNQPGKVPFVFWETRWQTVKIGNVLLSKMKISEEYTA